MASRSIRLSEFCTVARWRSAFHRIRTHLYPRVRHTALYDVCHCTPLAHTHTHTQDVLRHNTSAADVENTKREWSSALDFRSLLCFISLDLSPEESTSSARLLSRCHFLYYLQKAGLWAADVRILLELSWGLSFSLRDSDMTGKKKNEEENTLGQHVTWTQNLPNILKCLCCREDYLQCWITACMCSLLKDILFDLCAVFCQVQTAITWQEVWIKCWFLGSIRAGKKWDMGFYCVSHITPPQCCCVGLHRM